MKHDLHKITLVSIIMLVLLGCDYRFEAEPMVMDGTYSATTADSQYIVLTLSSEREVLSGYGTLGSNNVVFVEGGPKQVVGKLILPEGGMLPVVITFSGNENLNLEIAGETLTLKPEGSVSQPADGPFSGYYETSDLLSLMETLSLKQSGEIISGTALVLGQKVLISGWLVTPDSAFSRVILPDDTEFEITAIINNKNNLIVRGLGQPVLFERR
jgi:hypothetical protein